MDKNDNKPKIKIMKNGPYIVTGNVPLYEQIIVPKGKGYIFKEGRALPQAETYALCRCGKSKNAPFCDGSHSHTGFVGTETASQAKYNARAIKLRGPELSLLDDNRCAYARFCHRNGGSAWELVHNTANPKDKEEAIKAANECPSGRLTVIDSDGNAIEPEYEPSIIIIQDPEEDSSGFIFVRGNIPIESANGFTYEVRNRVALCRCGQSKNKPFCDATHIRIRFTDK